MIIYNDYKNKDWLLYKEGLPKGTIVVINNETYDPDVVEHLEKFHLVPLYSYKILEETYADPSFCVLDAENYRGIVDYPSMKTEWFENTEILFPEDLGGPKYRGYEDFILRVSPAIVCMERTYNVWKPWELWIFWKRNAYLRDRGIETYMGIWPESLPKICQKIQLFFARLISGNRIFWYSETKTLPGREVWQR